MKQRIYLCDGCGRRVKLPEGMHWCGCNPRAPFRMIEATIRAASTRALGMLKGLKVGR